MPDWSYPNQYMSQAQYYEQEWVNHQHSSPSQWGYNSPEFYHQQPHQQTASYNPYQGQPIEEKYMRR